LIDEKEVKTEKTITLLWTSIFLLSKSVYWDHWEMRRSALRGASFLLYSLLYKDRVWRLGLRGFTKSQTIFTNLRLFKTVYIFETRFVTFYHKFFNVKLGRRKG